jgi:hypothetical protein
MHCINPLFSIVIDTTTTITTITITAVVGKGRPLLQSHVFEWVCDWVRLIAALHHAMDTVE